ncbi:MAG: Gfo/Idh/MocA family oxidoreductase [Petrimonas sp.]|uniref:Gfo/Idh/MocA family protein n=1 Tax=Petrimonas sp. TaxID=2023866 RepID=UPI002B3F458E|nr:Gfo/Idh/MocA family oxidoreductase [Petrimonas sp.]MEA5045648.1 Gfo/Idh/MocA family oxidoreductase [Petrimonas sp.]
MKVLIIGLGSIVKKHINALQEIDSEIEFIALRSSRKAIALENIKNIYDWGIIKKKSPDFIIISNPTSLHFNTLQKLKDYSIPLFIEKPLFSEVSEESDCLVKEISDKGIINYVACNLRFLHCIQKIRNITKKERINEVNVYCGSFLPDWRPGVDFRSTYSANKEMGGGVHIDLIHELDYVFWLFGKPQYTRSFFKNNSSLEISAVDYANYLWNYKSFTASIILNYYRKQPRRSLEIICESGTYSIDLLQNSIIYNGNLIYSSEQRIKDTYKDQMLFFIHRILTKNEIFNSVEEANNILKLCLAQ